MTESTESNDASDPAIVHRGALVIDAHADTARRFVDESWDFTSPLQGGMLNLDAARAGNLAAEFFAIWVEPTQWKGRYAHRALVLLDGVHQQVLRHPDTLRLCTSPEGILAARHEKQFAVLIGIEGGHAIENNLALLRMYHTLGARYMTLTWNNSNEWADSSGDIDEPVVHHHNGLTPFGRDVVGEMNRLGMMVDVSHSSDKTFADVLETTDSPIIASHSSARALTAAPRNMTDGMLRAVAKNGGVVMVNFFSGFLDEEWRAAWNAQSKARHDAHSILEEQGSATGQPLPRGVANQIDRSFAAKLQRPALSALIGHIDHIIRIAGIEHVGLGSDFDGIPATPEGLNSAADLAKITAALMARGHSAGDVAKVLGSNLMRVFREVQSAAKS